MKANKGNYLIAFAKALLLLPLPLLAGTKPDSNISKKELHVLIKNAKTQQDHEKLGAYYRAEAQSFEEQRAEHIQMAKEYADNPLSHRPTKWPDPSRHCRDLVNIYTQAAKNSAALAEYHEGMASELAKPGLAEQPPK